MNQSLGQFEWHGKHYVDDANQIKFLKDSLKATNAEAEMLESELEKALAALQKMTAERNKLVNDLAVSSIDAEQSRHELRVVTKQRDELLAELKKVSATKNIGSAHIVAREAIASMKEWK